MRPVSIESGNVPQENAYPTEQFFTPLDDGKTFSYGSASNLEHPGMVEITVPDSGEFSAENAILPPAPEGIVNGIQAISADITDPGAREVFERYAHQTLLRALDITTEA